MRRVWLLAPLLALAAAAACVIGPKQDDPSSLEVVDGDSGSVVDTGDKGLGDTSVPTTTPDGGTGLYDDAAEASGDAQADGDARADGDASSDASCGDGTVPLTASGPWNDAKSCWESASVVFECVTGLDGGTVFTCFAKVSTGQLFLAPSTHIPSGSDYRVCTEAERTKTGAPPVPYCK